MHFAAKGVLMVTRVLLLELVLSCPPQRETLRVFVFVIVNVVCVCVFEKGNLDEFQCLIWSSN